MDDILTEMSLWLKLMRHAYHPRCNEIHSCGEIQMDECKLAVYCSILWSNAIAFAFSSCAKFKLYVKHIFAFAFSPQVTVLLLSVH